MRLVSCSAAAILCLSAFVASSVAAQPESARAHFRRGQEYVANDRFEDAYREFSAGYALSDRPLFLFNMAECSRQLGNTDRAIRDYNAYLALVATGEQADLARSRLSELGAASRADAGTPQPPTRIPSTDPTPPLGGRATSSDAAVPTGPSTTAAPIEMRLDAPPPTDTNRSIFESWEFWVVTGVVLVAAGVTVGVVVGTQNGPPPCRPGTCIDFSM